jgi:hypothetical protein
VAELLDRGDFASLANEWSELPLRLAVSALFSFLYAVSPEIKWRAVTAMGRLVAVLADNHLEQARDVMRRLMWNLNDESGGIGWGSPEAMAEIMSNHPVLAAEYTPILIAYLRKDGNYLDHDGLLCGVLWGVGRLARSRPQELCHVARYVVPFLRSTDPCLRGMALWALSAVNADVARTHGALLQNDSCSIAVYQEGRLVQRTIADLVAEARRMAGD